MKRIYYLSKRIAKDVVESTVKNHSHSMTFIQEEIKFEE